MRTLPTPLVAALLLALAMPLHAQHAGHAGHHAHVMPQPKPATKKAPAKPAAKKPAPKPAAKAPARKATPADHAAMGHGAHAPPEPAPKPAARTATKTPAKTAPKKPVVDHAAMGHGTPAAPGATVDHAAMGHGSPPPKDRVETEDHAGMDHAAMDHGSPAAVDHAAMGHGTAPGTPIDHAAMGHGSGGDLPADASPRTPIPALTDADRAAAFPPGLHGHTTHDRGIHSFWLADRLEWQDSEDGAFAWEGVAWIGGDIHRLWLRSEGEAAGGEVEHGDVEVLYGRSVTPWWDVVAGLRQDVGHGPKRTWAAVGLQGLAPYKFEVEATAYVGSGGRTAATLEAEYDTLITNRLILQWQAEASLHGQGDPALGIGSGLSTVEAGARLRYEVSRRFAPYIGVQLERAFGGTADLRREDGEPTRDTRLVAGIRFWF